VKSIIMLALLCGLTACASPKNTDNDGARAASPPWPEDRPSFPPNPNLPPELSQPL